MKIPYSKNTTTLLALEHLNTFRKECMERGISLTPLAVTDVATGLYGRACVSVGDPKGRPLPAHRLGAGDQVRLHSTKGSIGTEGPTEISGALTFLHRNHSHHRRRNSGAATAREESKMKTVERVADFEAVLHNGELKDMRHSPHTCTLFHALFHAFLRSSFQRPWLCSTALVGCFHGRKLEDGRLYGIPRLP